MIRIADAENLKQVFHYQLGFQAPYFFPVNYNTWEESFANDSDGEGRILFRELTVKAAYDGGALIGFIQYGKTAFGFDDCGDISADVSYSVIRNLYFDENRLDAGHLLLKEALDAFSAADKVYAFFHYFGMSCFARHGKLFQQHRHIETLLKNCGFETEHENVYYSSVLKGEAGSDAQLIPHDMTSGRQQYFDFQLLGASVGGCQIHFPDHETAYLRWIYVNQDMAGRGIGTRCMQTLKHWLYEKGVRRFDTDTALSNTVAQQYYEKNSFTREGITRSYYLLR